MLSEDDIKKAFLPFLKQFYRYRYEYRPESIHAELDNVSAGGLVADGMLTFRKADGSPFVCTYEATSVDKAEEVKYALNVLYFSWDCLAFGAFTAAVVYAAVYVVRFSWLVSLQWTGNVGFVLGMGIIGFFAWYFTMRSWRKYRYIYAIEQFKQYFADEQWIALGDDVFPAPSDPYLRELKSQCVYNGFGLALIPEQGEVRVLSTPSRLGIYGKDRRMVHWVTRINWVQTMSQNVSTLARYRPVMPNEWKQAWNKLWRPLAYLLFDPIKKGLWKAFSKPLGRSNSTFDRYMHGHSVQKWVFSLALLAIVPLAYRVLTVREETIDDVVQRPEQNPEDQYGYLYEGPRPSYRDPRGIPRQDPEPVSNPDIQTINLSGDNDQEEPPTINLSGNEDDKEPQAVPGTKSQTGTTAKVNPCAGVRALKGWVIQDNSFSTKSLANERSDALQRQGIDNSVVPKACIGDGNSGFVILLGASHASETAATAAAGNLTKAMERYGLLQGPLLVRHID